MRIGVEDVHTWLCIKVLVAKASRATYWKTRSPYKRSGGVFVTHMEALVL